MNLILVCKHIFYLYNCFTDFQIIRSDQVKVTPLTTEDNQIIKQGL